jgi:hypothetical protein
LPAAPGKKSKVGASADIAHATSRYRCVKAISRCEEGNGIPPRIARERQRDEKDIFTLARVGALKGDVERCTRARRDIDATDL